MKAEWKRLASPRERSSDVMATAARGNENDWLSLTTSSPANNRVVSGCFLGEWRIMSEHRSAQTLEEVEQVVA
jgi:hypothetical protein